MATPRLTKQRLEGALGEILVDVRSSDPASRAPAVIILHGFKGFKDWGMFPAFAERVARSGFTAVSYTNSGSGVDDTGNFTRPERFGHNTFSAELADLRTVHDALLEGRLGVATPSAIGLVGHSRGGGVAVLSAAALPDIRALVTWAAVSRVQRWSAEMRRRWREAGHLDVTNQRTGQVLPLYPDVLDDIERNEAALDIEAHAAALHIPWLIVHGEVDETVPFAEARVLAACAPDAQLLPIPRTGHTFGAAHPLESRPPSLEQVFDATLGFLGRHLA